MSKIKKVFIKKSVIKNINMGHPWCFSGAIQKVEPGINDGDTCRIYCEDKYVGAGYYNSKSDITVRMLTRQQQKIDSQFFIKKIKALKEQKEKFIEDSNCYRVVFGESDNLPGLIIDKYDDVFVVQIHTLGMDKLKNNIVDALINIYHPKCIYERSDLGIRSKEGLPSDTKQVLYGKPVKEVDVIEHGYKFRVNIVEGQKTGFFLDQRENRLALQKYCKDQKVLNCFSYTGGFSVYAAKVATSVSSIDISKPAVQSMETNFKINGYDLKKHEFIAEDVFDYLQNLKKKAFDVIILDPPSFAKSKKQVKNAIKAYITINSKALEKLPNEGILVSSSCTAHIDETTFIKILHQSAANANCQLKVIESRCQAFDHPYNLSFPEGRYLKYFVMMKVPLP